MWGTVKSRGAFIIAAAIVMTVSTLAASSAAGATVKVTGAGTVQCTAVGRVHAAPPLTTTPNASTHLVITAKLTCSQGTTGNPAVTVTTGKFSGKTAPFSAGCQSTAFGPGSAKVMWKATGGKVDKSVLTWSTATATDGPNVILDLTGPGAPGSGSYAGADFHVHLVGNAVTGGLCGGAKRGFAFTGSGGTSTLDIATPNPNNLPIKHVVVLMQENRSADNYLAQLSTQGQPNYEAEPTTGNPDPTNPLGPPIVPFHKTTYCEVADLNHSWNGTHAEYNGGAMDGFTAANVNALDPNGSRTMGYYDQTDLPYYYGLYSTFATGDRYFASTLT